jgi:putative addiction module CopG family antidote
MEEALMEIMLTPESEAVVRQKVADGRFASATEVVEAAVLLLDERDRMEYLRGLLLEAEQEVREGKTIEWTPELRQRLREEAAEQNRQGVPLDPDVCP